MNNWYQCVRS